MNGEEEATVKVYEKDRSLVMTLPKQIRRRLNIRDGTRLSLKVSGDLITLYKTEKAQNMEDPVVSTFFDLLAGIRDLRDREVRLEISSRREKIERWKYEDMKHNINEAYRQLEKEFYRIKGDLNNYLKKIDVPHLRLIGEITSFRDLIILAVLQDEKEFDERIEELCAEISQLEIEKDDLIILLESIEDSYKNGEISEECYIEEKSRCEKRLEKINEALAKVKTIAKST